MIFFKEPGIQFVIQVRTRFGKESEPTWSIPTTDFDKFAVYGASESFMHDWVIAQKAYGKDNVRVLRVTAELVEFPQPPVIDGANVYE